MLLGLAIFFLVLILVLAIPVSLSFKTCWKQTMEGHVKLQWAYGLVSIRHNLLATKPKSAKLKKPKRNTRRVESSSGRNFMAALRQPPFRRRLIKFVSDLWHTLEKSDVRVSLRIGLDDPAATGQLWAVIGPITGMLFGYREVSLVVEPVFHESCFEVDSSGSIRVIPLKIVSIMLAMIVSPVVWKELRPPQRLE